MKQLNLNVTKEGIAWLEWNQAHSSVNLITSSFIKELSEIVESLDLSQIKVLIFVSTKKDHFCSGADIKEICDTKSPEDLEHKINQIHELFSHFEHLNICKIAAIEGSCLGGGLEWALCFDYRLVSNSSKTQLGCPEVKLGLIPGFGACIRLPKLVGLIKALKIITTGKSLNSKQAYRIGLADEEVPRLILKKRALALAHEVLDHKLPFHPKNKFKDKKMILYWVDLLFNSIICFISKKQVLEKTKGFYPAPIKAIEVINQSYQFALSHKQLQKERSAFVELFKSPASKNLIRLFLTIDKAKKKFKTQNLQKDQKAIEKIAVLGAGLMGSSIAYFLVNKGFKVRLFDNNPKALCSALKKINQLIDKQNKIDKYEKEHRKNLLSLSESLQGFKHLDLVIEALPENLRLKKEVIHKVSQKLAPEGLFATNTSSLDIEELAQSSAKASHFFGLHFFNPVPLMPLVEVCLTPSQQEQLTSIPDFIKKMGKTPLLIKNSPGFIVNRLLLSYLLECLKMLEEGYDIKKLDQLFKEKAGFPLGPFETMDKVGLDTCIEAVSNIERASQPFNKPQWIKDLTKILGAGEKEEKGFYLYKEEEKILNPKTEILKKQEKSADEHQIQLLERPLREMILAGEKLLELNIAETKEDIDMAMILGSGFPAFLGGPMHYKSNHFKGISGLTIKL